MFWRSKYAHKKDDVSSSLLPGNAEAKSNSSNGATYRQEHRGVLNRAVRRMAQSTTKGSSVLPTHTNPENEKRNSTYSSSYKPHRTYAGRSAPGSSPCNSFLLGGTYYPGKDKRRRIHHHHNRQRRSFCFRVFCSSMVRMLLTLCLLLYAVRKFFFLPMSKRIVNEVVTSKKHSGMRMPLKDSKLVREVLDGVDSVKEKMHRFNSKKISKGVLSEEKLEAIRQIDPQWANRNDIQKQRNNEPKKEAAHVKKTKKRENNAISIKNKLIETMEHDILDKPLRTLQNFDTSGSSPTFTNDSELSVTLVIQSTPERLYLMEETCRRWTDPIVLVVYNSTFTKDDSSSSSMWESSWESQFQWESKCPQIHIISVQPSASSKPHEYPVNKLRNLGLTAIKTTHFLVLDIDFIPSTNLQSTIYQHLMQAVSKELEALVVPAFQKQGDPPCHDTKQCQSFLNENPEYLPSSFEGLKKCMGEVDGCAVFQSHDNLEGHFTTNSKRWLRQEWYEDESGDRMPLSIPCFHSFRYEPYLVLRWNPNRTPMYDERFYGYGKNKIQYVAHLRFMHYTFRILPEGFIIHFPHNESESKKIWNDIDGNDLHLNMDQLYPKFLSELKGKYGLPKLQTC